MTNSSSQSLLAIDIGGTKLAIGLADRQSFLKTGKLDRILKEPIAGSGRPAEVIAQILEVLDRIVDGDRRSIGRVGISIGGPLDHEEGIVLNFPHLPEWIDIPLRSIIEDKLNVSARLDNDANLGALAEYTWGAGKGCDPFVYLTISTGIGGGIVIGGELLHGVGTGAGEIGHITVQTDGPLCPCGNRGCLERMASGTNIARRAQFLLEKFPARGEGIRELIRDDFQHLTAQTVYAAYRKGDELAVQVWDEITEYIAIGLGSIIHTIAPRKVVLGGGVAQTGEDLLKPIREKLRHHVFYVNLDAITVCRAQLEHDSALIGAAVIGARIP